MRGHVGLWEISFPCSADQFHVEFARSAVWYTPSDVWLSDQVERIICTALNVENHWMRSRGSAMNVEPQ